MTSDSSPTPESSGPPPQARPAEIPQARPLGENWVPAGEQFGPGALAPVPLAPDSVAPVPVAAHPMTLAPIGPLRAVLHLLILVVSAAVALVVAGMLIGPLESLNAKSQGAIDLLSTTVISLLVVALAVVLVRDGGGSAASLGLTTRGLFADLRIGLLVTLLSFAVFFVTMAVMHVVWPEGIRQLQQNPKNVDDLVPAWSPVALLGAMFCVALSEESLFRGVLLPHLRCLTRNWTVAVLVSSGLFAVLHVINQERAAAVALYPVAILWSLVVIWRRSLVASVVGHALFNWLMLMFMRFATPVPA